jgi:hypothetical protein
VTALVVLPQTEALERYADAGEFIVLSCERAKEWLVNCVANGDLDQLVEMKSQADAIRVYSTAKQLGRDAELAAAEIVRRAERGIGLCIRKGQDQGKIRKRGERGPINALDKSIYSCRQSPEDFVSTSELSGNGAGIYHLTDGVTDEQFDEAIAEAKNEGNLSRANVVRKVACKKIDVAADAVDKVQTARDMAAAGYTTAQIATELGYTGEGTRRFLDRHGIAVPADAIVGKRRKLDSNRIVSTAVDSVVGIGDLFDAVDYSELDATQFDYWVRSLSVAIRSLTTLKNNIKKEQTQ